MDDRNCQSLPTFCQSNDDSRLDNKPVNVIKIVIYNLNKHITYIYIYIYIYIFHLVVPIYQKMNITSVPLFRWGNGSLERVFTYS